MWQTKLNKLSKKIEFRNFSEAIDFVNKVAKISDKANHHPKITIDYNKVELELFTHDKNDTVTEKDHNLAKQIDKINKETKLSDHYAKIYADGGSRGNPGPAASGYVIYDEKDRLVARGGRFLGETTNNQAEYDSLYQSLLHCNRLGANNVDIFMDSQLVIKQMKGEYKVKHPEIQKIYKKIITELIPKFNEVTFTHVPRELNKEADAEVNKVLDSQ